MQLTWDEKGLVTVVVQDRLTGEIRMVAHANREAIEQTRQTRKAHFWSRSRQKLWMKGEESGHVLDVHEMWVDCDHDALIYAVDPHGPTCHTGEPSCFFEHIEGSRDCALPLLSRLEETLQARSTESDTKSYTRSLLSKGATHIGSKIREEADELARAIESESDERVISEAADLLYHAMVGLLHRKLKLRQVFAELARRFGVSGLEEKASRVQ